MLTKVYLDGVLGAKFGDEWEFEISSPKEAIQMIEANNPGIVGWLKINSRKYPHYKVTVEHYDGTVDEISEERFVSTCNMKTIRFTPIIEGSGKWYGVIVGVIVMIIGVLVAIYGDPSVGAAIFQWGAEMTIVALIVAVTTKTPKRMNMNNGNGSSASLLSSGFANSQNTATQGTPVPIIYGQCLVGSQPISVGTIIE